MDLGLQNKVALVMGASRGMGLAVAEKLVQEGVRVVINSRDAKSLKAVADELTQKYKQKVLPLPGDIGNGEQCKAILKETLDRFAGLDILFCNAGGPTAGSFEDVKDKDWDAAVDVNLKGMIRMMRLSYPIMKKNNWGRIVTLTSMSVKEVIDNLVLSNVTRLGVAGAVKSLSREVASFGITVNNVCPGLIDTGRWNEIAKTLAKKEKAPAKKILEMLMADNNKRIPMGRMGTPEEVANVVVFLMSQQAAYLTGQSISVDGGITRSIF